MLYYNSIHTETYLYSDKSSTLELCITLYVRHFSVFILQTDLEIKCYSRYIVSVTNLASSRIERLHTYS